MRGFPLTSILILLGGYIKMNWKKILSNIHTEVEEVEIFEFS